MRRSSSNAIVTFPRCKINITSSIYIKWFRIGQSEENRSRLTSLQRIYTSIYDRFPSNPRSMWIMLHFLLNLIISRCDFISSHIQNLSQRKGYRYNRKLIQKWRFESTSSFFSFIVSSATHPTSLMVPYRKVRNKNTVRTKHNYFCERYIKIFLY